MPPTIISEQPFLFSFISLVLGERNRWKVKGLSVSHYTKIFMFGWVWWSIGGFTIRGGSVGH